MKEIDLSQNPTVAEVGPTVNERTRIPMSVPVANLAVPEIPGYHLHWFRGEPQRIQRAQEAGYEFVNKGEVLVNNKSLGSDPASDGNTDMGTRVSHISGSDLADDGQPQRLYLMKIKEEWWIADQKALTAEGSRLDGVRKALLGGRIGSESQSAPDRAQTYVDTKRTRLPSFLERKA